MKAIFKNNNRNYVIIILFGLLFNSCYQNDYESSKPNNTITITSDLGKYCQCNFEVVIDGEFVGIVPNKSSESFGNIPDGTHSVVANGVGFLGSEIKITVEGGLNYRLKFIGCEHFGDWPIWIKL